MQLSRIIYPCDGAVMMSDGIDIELTVNCRDHHVDYPHAESSHFSLYRLVTGKVSPCAFWTVY